MPESPSVNVFRPVVQAILNNWTALRLAVEHGMGGPMSKQIAIELVDYLAHYCCENQNVDAYELVDIMDEILNEEFDTICEDDSQREIATLLVRYIKLINDGSISAVEDELSRMKPCDIWLCQTGPRNANIRGQNNEDDDDDDSDFDSDSSSEDDVVSVNPALLERRGEPMEDDDGWTVVKTKRK